MRQAIYPGSFDPLTNGHLNIVERGLQVFDRLVVAIATNPSKSAMYSVEDRRAMLEEATGHDDRVEIDSFEGLLVDYCAKREINIVLRGLRAVSDFEYELQMANMNRKLYSAIETVFMMSSEEHFYVSSRFVREVIRYGGDVSELVPESVQRRLADRSG